MATVVVFVDVAVFKSMVVVVVVEEVVGVAVYTGAGIFCEAPASHITNAAHKSMIVFQTPLGKGPDWFSFQFSSICRSQMLHCATVLSNMAGGCGCVGICSVVSCCLHE